MRVQDRLKFVVGHDAIQERQNELKDSIDDDLFLAFTRLGMTALVACVGFLSLSSRILPTHTAPVHKPVARIDIKDLSLELSILGAFIVTLGMALHSAFRGYDKTKKKIWLSEIKPTIESYMKLGRMAFKELEPALDAEIRNSIKLLLTEQQRHGLNDILLECFGAQPDTKKLANKVSLIMRGTEYFPDSCPRRVLINTIEELLLKDTARNTYLFILCQLREEMQKKPLPPINKEIGYLKSGVIAKAHEIAFRSIFSQCETISRRAHNNITDSGGMKNTQQAHAIIRKLPYGLGTQDYIALARSRLNDTLHLTSHNLGLELQRSGRA